MPISTSDHLDLPKGALEGQGAFDAVLDVDSRLFIDPHLARVSGAPELATVPQSLDRRFTEIMLLLGRSQRQGDTAWRNADLRLNFREPKGLCIGYSRKSTSGSGIGPRLKAHLLETAKEIVEAGIQDPVFFELMGLLEEGIGADRISDMTARIVFPELGAFSERVFRNLGVEGTTALWTDRGNYTLPANPHNHQPILLVPMDVLRDLPVADSWADVDFVVSFNAELRQQVNALIGETWRRKRRPPKAVLRELLISNPELFREITARYRATEANAYDFADDPLGEVQWYEAGKAAARNFPLRLVFPAAPSGDDLLGVVLEIARRYRQLIETNGLWELLYCHSGQPKRESAAQRLFYGISDAYCDANDIDISPETNAGRGQVDFKLSRGRRAKVVVETKLTSNTALIHGFDIQLPLYAMAERTEQRVYIVVDVTAPGSDARLRQFQDHVEERKLAGDRVPVVIYVNGRQRPSASVAPEAR